MCAQSVRAYTVSNLLFVAYWCIRSHKSKMRVWNLFLSSPLVRLPCRLWCLHRCLLHHYRYGPYICACLLPFLQDIQNTTQPTCEMKEMTTNILSPTKHGNLMRPFLSWEYLYERTHCQQQPKTPCVVYIRLVSTCFFIWVARKCYVTPNLNVNLP